MADQEVPVASGEDGTVSKNALKKLLKAEEAAKKKAAKDAEKDAKKASQPQAAVKAADDEDLDPTQYYENRIKAINSLEVKVISLSTEYSILTQE